jgi:hypothetical protein
MALRDNVVKAGMPPTAAAAGASQGTGVTNLVAAGTTQATALALPADVCHFGTVAANSGAILPACNSGDCGTIFNGGASALKVYPPVGAQINGLGANNPYSIAAATPASDWYCASPTQFIMSQSA